MLYDGYRRFGEIADEFYGSLHVQEVVVAEFLAVKLLRKGVLASEEYSPLMRVLSVSQRLCLCAEAAEDRSLCLGVEIIEDGAVVRG